MFDIDKENERITNKFYELEEYINTSDEFMNLTHTQQALLNCVKEALNNYMAMLDLAEAYWEE